MDGDEREAKERGQKGRGRGLKNSKHTNRETDMTGVSVSLLLVVVHFSFSNSTYELAFKIYSSPKPNWLYIPLHCRDIMENGKLRHLTWSELG